MLTLLFILFAINFIIKETLILKASCRFHFKIPFDGRGNDVTFNLLANFHSFINDPLPSSESTNSFTVLEKVFQKVHCGRKSKACAINL